MSTPFRSLVVLLASCSLPLSSRGQLLVIDQHNDPPVPPALLRYWSLSFPGASPLGQEFVPVLGTLDFVDLVMFAGGGAATGTFELRLHQGSITAPVVATSTPTLRTDGSEMVTHFQFASSVPLSAGGTWVMELVQLGGDTGAWGVGDTGGGYAAGQMLWGGQPTGQGGDLWFREGIVVVPEPRATSLCALAVALLYLFRRRRHAA